MNHYTVVTRDGCTLVEGSIPIDHLAALSRLQPDAVIAPQLARLARASIAWGSREDVAALTKLLTEQADRPGLTPLQRWLAIGERGSSSDAIVAHLRGAHTDDPKAYPHDPDDLHRCLMLLQDVPELVADFSRMAEVSPVWAALVARWPELVSMLEEEAGADWRAKSTWAAPRLFALMRQIIEAAEVPT